MLHHDRAMGALIGLLLGDAVGTTLEFKPPDSFEPIDDMVGGGPFRLQAGAFTDDGSMALCLAESLVEKRRFDGRDVMERFVRWYRTGYWSSTGVCFDIGNTTVRALEHFEQTGDPFAGSTDERTQANGSLMRLSPAAIFGASDPARALELAAQQSRLTHAHPACLDACRFFAGLLVSAMNGASKKALLSPLHHPAQDRWSEGTLHPRIEAVARGSWRDREPPAIQGSGYVVASLEASIWSFATTGSFRDAVLKAANLGDDADTTAAITGQLAGAFYGVAGMPDVWLEKLVMRERVFGLAESLVRLGTGEDALG